MTVEHRAAFAEMLQRHGDHPPLDVACALVAAEEQPGVLPERVLGRLDAIGEQIHVPDGANRFEAAARINHHLFEKMGLQGDSEDYDHPRNSMLDQVLDRRKGLPILLSVAYIELARRAGVAVDGVAFPGHFLVSPMPPDEATERFYVDPFHKGEILSRSRLSARLQKMGTRSPGRYLAPCSSRFILIRIHNNLKRAYLRRDNLSGALRCVERLLLLDPGDAQERRDRGLLLARIGEDRAAAGELERYLSENPEAPDKALIAQQIALLQEE